MSAKLSLVAIALSAMTLVPSAPASAQGYYFNTGFGANINARQQMELNRINSLRARGMLTPGEYDRLMDRFNRISSEEAAMRLGGLTWREREILNDRLSDLNRDITIFGNNDNRMFRRRDFAYRGFYRHWF